MSSIMRRREPPDAQAFSRKQQQDCVQMPGKMAGLAPRPLFGLPKVTLAVQTERMSSRQAEKALVFTPLRESSGESRLNASARDKWRRARSRVVVSIVIEEQRR
jgi:hypothetical protein